MSVFPNSLFSPRTKANRNGVVYDANKATVTYAEDIVALDNEIVAIETELGVNPKGAFSSVSAFLGALGSDVSDLFSAVAAKMSNPMSAAGDLIVGAAAGAPARLGKGSAGYILKVNADASSIEWSNPVRVVTASDHASAVISIAVTDVYELSAVANNTTFSISGTPYDGQSILVRIKDAGTVKTLTWNSIFSPIGVVLPVATVANKWIIVGAKYNSFAAKFQVLAVGLEA